MNDTLCRVKIIYFISIALTIVLISDKNYWLGIPVMLLGFFIEWKFYRCPHCHKTIDIRLKIDPTTHCPRCGERIKQEYR